MPRIRITSALIITTLALAGCSAAPADTGSTPTPAPTVTVTATATKTVTPEPKPNQGVLTAKSLTDFHDTLTDQGLTCENWETITAESGTCDDLIILTVEGKGSAGHRFYQLSLYQAWNVLRTQERQDVALLVGTNCFVRLGYEDAKTMQKRVGGVILN